MDTGMQYIYIREIIMYVRQIDWNVVRTLYSISYQEINVSLNHC